MTSSVTCSPSWATTMEAAAESSRCPNCGAEGAADYLTNLIDRLNRESKPQPAARAETWPEENP